jgi:hypothetical protein
MLLPAAILSVALLGGCDCSGNQLSPPPQQAASQRKPQDAPSREQTIRSAARSFASEAANGGQRRFQRVFMDTLKAAGVEPKTHAVRNNLREALSDENPTIIDVMNESAREVDHDPRFQEHTNHYIKTHAIPQVVGGIPTDEGEFPDCVAVGSDTNWCCTGTLVGSNVVITAGHCFSGDCMGENGPTRVFVGTDVNHDGQIVRVKKAIRHPGYSGATVAHDLMVLILEQNAVNGSGRAISARRLAKTELIDSAETVLVVGFGSTDKEGRGGYGRQIKAELLMASSACDGSDHPTKYGCHKGYELVAASLILHKDTCFGDSGGPLYVLDPATGEFYLAAATSRGISRTCGDGGIYVRIDKHGDWIRETCEHEGGHLGQR